MPFTSPAKPHPAPWVPPWQTVRDLLNPSNPEQVRIRETTRKGVWLDGVTSVSAGCAQVGHARVCKHLLWPCCCEGRSLLEGPPWPLCVLAWLRAAPCAIQDVLRIVRTGARARTTSRTGGVAPSPTPCHTHTPLHTHTP
jgi:hypothetical protein